MLDTKGKSKQIKEDLMFGNDEVLAGQDSLSAMWVKL